MIGDTAVVLARRADLDVQQGAAAVAFDPQSHRLARHHAEIRMLVNRADLGPRAARAVAGIRRAEPQTAPAGFDVRGLLFDPRADAGCISAVVQRVEIGKVGQHGGLRIVVRRYRVQGFDAGAQRLRRERVLGCPTLGSVAQRTDAMLGQAGRRQLPLADRVQTQAELPARLAQSLQRGLVEVPGQPQPLVPAQDGELLFHAGIPGAAGDVDALDRHGTVDGQILDSEILHFVGKVSSRGFGRPARCPPAQLRLEQIAQPVARDQSDVFVVELFHRPHRMVPSAQPRMEPPTVVAPLTGLGHAAVQTLEDHSAQGVDPVPAAHALRSVEIDHGHVALVVDAGDPVGQLGRQRTLRVGVERQITLLEVVDRGVLCVGSGSGLERSPLALEKGIGGLARDRRVADQFAADPQRIAVARVAPDHVVV